LPPAAVLLALAVLAAGFSAAMVSDSAAQEVVKRPWTLRDLFAPRKADRLEPPAEIPKRRVRERKKAAPKAAAAARAPRERKTDIVDKQEDAKVVLVIGDFLAGGLAEGLESAYADRPGLKIVDRTSGSSGFVRDDYYDWPKKVVELIERDKPAAIVVMLGANDRQDMKIGETSEEPLSEKWSEQYALRTQALATAISERKIPFVWVGVPAFKSPKMLSDMLAFNDIYRAAAEGAGAEFVDIWDGFVDENGGYVQTGPDLNGQPVRLRSNDGINLTRPGKRKLAFFAEKPLAKLLDETGVPGVATLAPASAAVSVPAAVDIGSIKRTEPVSLQDPELDGGAELLGRVVEPKRNVRSPGEKLAIEGIAPDAMPGRADDFSAPPAAAPPAIPLPAVETTTAIKP
jgi:hypothetical protein